MAAAPESPLPTLAPTPLVRTGLSRRGVVRTALWSVPAVTVATASPAYAASTTNQLSFGDNSGLDWYTQRQGFPDQFNAAAGGIGFETSSSTAATPPLRLTLQFPDNWTFGNNSVFVAPNPHTPPWEHFGWVSDVALDGDGRLTSASGSFGFTHPGGPGVEILLFPFMAWSRASGLDAQSIPVSATVQILASAEPLGWDLAGGPVFSVPVTAMGSGGGGDGGGGGDDGGGDGGGDDSGGADD